MITALFFLLTTGAPDIPTVEAADAMEFATPGHVARDHITTLYDHLDWLELQWWVCAPYHRPTLDRAKHEVHRRIEVWEYYHMARSYAEQRERGDFVYCGDGGAETIRYHLDAMRLYVTPVHYAQRRLPFPVIRGLSGR